MKKYKTPQAKIHELQLPPYMLIETSDIDINKYIEDDELKMGGDD